METTRGMFRKCFLTASAKSLLGSARECLMMMMMMTMHVCVCGEREREAESLRDTFCCKFELSL